MAVPINGERVFEHRNEGVPVAVRIFFPVIWVNKLFDESRKFSQCSRITNPSDHVFLNKSYEIVDQRCQGDRGGVAIKLEEINPTTLECCSEFYYKHPNVMDAFAKFKVRYQTCKKSELP